MKSQLSSKSCSNEWLRRAQFGSLEAFATLYEEHKARIYSLCLSAAKDRARAEELTQSAFVKAFRKLATVGENTDFSNWVYQVAMETVLTYQRKAPVAPLSVDPILELARESVCEPRNHARFGRMRAKLRTVRLHLDLPFSWTPGWRFGRSRQEIKTMA